jgi:hypothetical protein
MARIFIQSAHEGGKVVSPTHRPALPPREDPRSTKGPEGLITLSQRRHRETNLRSSVLQPSTAVTYVFPFGCVLCAVNVSRSRESEHVYDRQSVRLLRSSAATTYTS